MTFERNPLFFGRETNVFSGRKAKITLFSVTIIGVASTIASCLLPMSLTRPITHPETYGSLYPQYTEMHRTINGPSNDGGVTEATFTPDNQSIIFMYSGSKLEESHAYRIDLNSGRTENLTRGHRFDWSPEVSPDGRYIVFLSRSARFSDTTRQLCIIDIKAGRFEEVSLGGLTPWSPLTISPDSSRVGFGTPTGIHAYNFTDGSVARISEHPTTARQVSPAFLTKDRVVFSQWLADRAGYQYGRCGVFLLDLGTSQLTALSDSNIFGLKRLIVSPNHEIVLFELYESRTYRLPIPHASKIEESTPEEPTYLGILRQLTITASNQALTFVKEHEIPGKRGLWDEIHTLNLQTSETTQVTDLFNHTDYDRGSKISFVKCSPDGQQLLFLVIPRWWKLYPTHDLWVANADGTNSRKVFPE